MGIEKLRAGRLFHTTVKEYAIGHSATSRVKRDNVLWEKATKRAIVDVMILKECDTLLVTRGSTFCNLSIYLQQSYGLDVTLEPFLKRRGLNCSVFSKRRQVGSYMYN